MAEGLAKQILGSHFQIYSAGIEAHGLNPKAISSMREIDIDIHNQESNIIDHSILNKAQHIITLCGDAAEKCPIVPSQAKVHHWGLPDPAKASGSNEEILIEFAKVRDEIKKRILEFKDSVL